MPPKKRGSRGKFSRTRMASNPRRVHSSDEGEESSTAPAAPTTPAIFDLLPDIMVDSSQPPLHRPSPPDVGRSPQGTTSAPSAPALYDLLPDGMMEGSQPQPPPPAAVKAKLQSAGGVDTSTSLYDMLPFGMEDDSPPPSPIAQSSLATTAKGVTSLAASFKDITFFTGPLSDPESEEGAVMSEADDSPSEQGLFAEGVDDVDEDNEVLPASSENADDDGDDDEVGDLKRLKRKLDFLRVELLRVARHCEVLSEEVGNIIRKADDM
ncbi:hypothetical protein BJY52DRAFT_1226903 [Lactarius psammicola]|nr:hypothetical protein BJY52DRAFT_1227250 [Lactarius psammicola]KAI9450963.1 hypothetical protein BJY52DRAFT_1226903 [Lactarius psammicola]